jgi:hypothetical protein
VQELLNKLVKITKYRGEPKNRTARVVNVRDTNTYPITMRSYRRKLIERSRYLITIHDLDKNEFRSYYHMYVEYEVVKPSLFKRLFSWTR